MRTEPQSVADVDLTDPDLFVHGDPHAVWRLLRRECPVHYNERDWGPGFWNVTRYADIVDISIDPETFISSKGIILDNDGRQAQREKQLAERGMYFEPRGSMMIMTDPPRHTFLRQLVNKEFTRKAVAPLEPHIRAIVTRILDDVCDRGECDFVMDVSRRLPLEVICEQMGVPEGDWEAMFDLTNRIIGFDDPEFAPESDEVTPEEMALTAETMQYMFEMCEARRREPRDDLLTALVHAQVDGEGLTDSEIFLFFILLIVAGNETTRNATTGGMLALMDNPDQLERLRDDRALMPKAVEEIVRWTTPVVHFERVATRDVEVRGVTIREGDEVTLWYPSGNRDEDVFDEPDRFDVGRDPNPHIAFGKGEHFCLGANLARLELAVMFDEILDRLYDVELTGAVERLRSNFIGGIKRMPISFRAS